MLSLAIAMHSSPVHCVVDKDRAGGWGLSLRRHTTARIWEAHEGIVCLDTVSISVAVSCPLRGGSRWLTLAAVNR